jgi:hypothetical protein
MIDKCLLLLARTDDPAFRTLQQQDPHRVVHASIADLSCAGWQYASGCPEEASAYAGGRVVRAEEIAAVICRIPAVAPTDLPHLHRDDRAYVAAEMNAFLRAWLAQFTGVRFNEPTWVSLAGPSWHQLTWARLMAEMGVPMVTLSQSMDLTRPRHETATGTVICGEVYGFTDPALADMSLRIARATRGKLLSVTFARYGEWKFHSAHPCPVLDSASAAALLRRAFAQQAQKTYEAHAGESCTVA